MKILIVVPSFKILGGVANHYQGLAPYWKNQVSYFFYGKRVGIPAIITFMPDLIAFVFSMIFRKYDLVIINPSLRSYQLFRDGLYLKIADFFGKKVVTFIHGWDEIKAIEIRNNPNSFCRTFGKSKFIYVLYSGFKKTLNELPINVPVLLTTTKVKNSLLEKFEIGSRDGSINNLLFLARADKLKGLDITIKIFEILKINNPQLKLKVCGTGNALQETIDYVKENNIPDIEFMGHVTGSEIAVQYLSSDLYILPTHSEGMATSVLEAMAFGLPIISRPVGGVNDFFINQKMGYLIKSFEPKDYAERIQYLIDNPSIVRDISRCNHEFAKEHFLASEVAKKIENDIERYL